MNLNLLRWNMMNIELVKWKTEDYQEFFTLSKDKVNKLFLSSQPVKMLQNA